MAKKTRNAKSVEIRPIKLATLKMSVVGDSPLIIHNFSAKAQAQMMAAQSKVAWPKEAKNPEHQYEFATYYIDDKNRQIECKAPLSLIAEGKVNVFLEEHLDFIGNLKKIKNPHFGFPAVGFKAAAIRGAKELGLVMTDMRGAFHIPVEFVEIEGERSMRSDMVRISHSTSDIRLRPEFKDWKASFDIVYNRRSVTPDILFNMFNVGGFCCGIGEWRPSKGGDKGMFHVASSD